MKLKCTTLHVHSFPNASQAAKLQDKNCFTVVESTAAIK